MTFRTETLAEGVTCILGDCREFLPTIADESIDFIFTDPPYGHNNNNGDLIHRWEAALGRLPCGGDTPLGRPIANDGAEDASALVRWAFNEFERLLGDGCCCCCCCSGGGPDPQFARWSLWLDEAVGFKQMLIWDKGPMGMGWHYRRSYETVLVGEKPGAACRWFDTTDKIENVIRPGAYGIRKIIPSKDEHPTPKPYEMAAHFIKLHTAPGHIVLDPFMGGGSTGVAAVKLGRRFIGCEVDPQWFDLSCRRISEALRQPDMFIERPKPAVQEAMF